MTILSPSDITLTDLFCGAGGGTEGLVPLGVVPVVAANHWKVACTTYGTNNPHADVACADISQLPPRALPRTRLLIAGPECTNHTSARNHAQAARELKLWNPEEEAERSRATMWDVPRFAEHHDYDACIIENVVEARSWRQFPAWLHSMESLGYEHGLVYLNSMFAPPTPQSRDRMYTIFWKQGMRRPNLDFTPQAFCPTCDTIVEAVQTWKSDFDTVLSKAIKRNGGRRPNRIRWGLFKQQYDFRCPSCESIVRPGYTPAFTAIDWSLKGQRIGDRGTPLADATMDRIRRGIEKYGLGPALVPLSHTQDTTRSSRPVTEAMPTQTARQDIALAHPFLHQLAGHTFERDNSTCRSRAVTEPLRTQTGTIEEGLVLVPFIAELHGGGSNARSVMEALATVEAGGNHHMLVHDGFLIRNYGSNQPAADWHVIDKFDPLATVTAQDHHGIVRMPMLDSYYRTGTLRPSTEAMATCTTHDRHGVVDLADLVDDCYYRMLEPHEVQKGMGMADSILITGSKRQKVRQLGNAMTPPAITQIGERVLAILDAA